MCIRDRDAFGQKQFRELVVVADQFDEQRIIGRTERRELVVVAHQPGDPRKIIQSFEGGDAHVGDDDLVGRRSFLLRENAVVVRVELRCV